MAEGYQSRFLEFQRFESKFKAFLGSSGKLTKIERYKQEAIVIVKQLRKLWIEAEQEYTSSWCVCVCNYYTPLYSRFTYFLAKR